MENWWKKSSKLEFLFSEYLYQSNSSTGLLLFLLHFWNDRILIFFLLTKSNVSMEIENSQQNKIISLWKRLKTDKVFLFSEIKSESFDWYVCVCVCVLFGCQHSFIWILLQNLIDILQLKFSPILCFFPFWYNRERKARIWSAELIMKIMRSQCYFFLNNENFTIVKITIIGKQFTQKQLRVNC